MNSYMVIKVVGANVIGVSARRCWKQHELSIKVVRHNTEVRALRYDHSPTTRPSARCAEFAPTSPAPKPPPSFRIGCRAPWKSWFPTALRRARPSSSSACGLSMLRRSLLAAATASGSTRSRAFKVAGISIDLVRGSAQRAATIIAGCRRMCTGSGAHLKPSERSGGQALSLPSPLRPPHRPFFRRIPTLEGCPVRD